MAKLCLIDGSNMMFRAYYATAYAGPLMQNSKGEYTNALYGMANILNALLKNGYTHIAVAFDKGKETYRHKTYEAYKAGRAKVPEEFISQMPKIEALVEHMGCFVYAHEALEADDIIASIAYQYKDDMERVDIVSNDKDLYQLLGANVAMRIQKKGLEPNAIFDEKALETSLGLKPHQIPDLKGLMGDASDNLPGVPGVGEKTAVKLLSTYETLEGIYENINDIKGKLKERLILHQDDAFTYRHLAKLILDASLPFSLDDLKYEGPKASLTNFYESLEFYSLIKKLDQKTNANDPKDTLTKTKAPSLYHEGTAVVLEYFGTNYHHASPLGFGLFQAGKASYLSFEAALKDEAFLDFLSDPTILKATYDVKALHVIAQAQGLKIAGVSFDVLLAAYLVNPAYTQKDLKVLSSHFDYEYDLEYDDVVYGKGKHYQIPSDDAISTHAMQKARAVYELKPVIEKALKDHDQWSLYETVERPLADVLSHMEITGIDLDLNALETFNEDLQEELEGLEDMIYGLAGETFNIDSPKQLGVVLFDTLGLPSYQKKKTGYSTNVDVLKKLEDKHPIIPAIMRYRTLKKLQSTYVNGLRQAVMDDGKIHTIYKQALTQTGRLSSIEPNLQNIPIRTDIGRELRKVFTAPKDRVLLASDYSQIELRLLAHLAQEKTLIEAFKEGEDIHQITGQNVFLKQTITDDERRLAKAVNFGIIYGQSAWSLADDLGIPLKQAEQFIERYYTQFSGIKAYMDSVIEGAQTNGYVTTLMARRRYIPELYAKIHSQREFGKRTAMNAPLQGSAADIIKKAMIDLDKALKEAGFDAEIILQIHDELVLSVHPDDLDEVKNVVRQTMESVVSLDVPLTVNMAHGSHLFDAK